MSIRKFLGAMLLCAASSGTSLVGQIAHKPVPKGADYYEILDLNARFCHGLDSGTDDGTMFSSAFLPDGAYIDTAGHETRGAAQLAAMARELPRTPGANPMHYVVNIRLQLVAGGARQWSYILVTGPSQPGQSDAVIDGGQYWDELAKTPQGWRIAKRTMLKPGTPRPEEATFFSNPEGAPATTTSLDKAGDKAGLTATDRAEIFQLYAHYPYALDEMLGGGQLFATLFAPDGVMVGASGKTISGRDSIAEYVWRRGLTDDKTYITNLMLERTRDGVNATAYVMNAHIPQLPAASTISPAGMFFDQLVKTSEGWKFKRNVLVAPHGSMPAPVAAASGLHPALVFAKAKQAWPLSADDYAEIQQLYGRYGQGFDSKAEDGAMYLSVFSKAGTFIDQYNKIVAGFENLDKLNAHSPTGKPNPLSITHSTWNLMVDAAPWGAVGRSYTGGGRVNTPGAAAAPGLLGMYIDMIVRTPVGWRFEQRTFRQDFPRPMGSVGGRGPASSR